MVFGVILMNYGPWSDPGWGPMNSRTYIVTPDRETADLLYRVLMDNGKNFPLVPVDFDRKRPSPQLWSWMSLRGDSQASIQEHLKLALNEINFGRVPMKEEHKKHLLGKITFDWRGNWNENGQRLPEIPHLDLPDHITGRVFSIRDKSCPTRFWAKSTKYLNEGCIEVSDTRKARFRVTIKGRADGKTVMVFDDAVTLELIERSGRNVNYLPVNIDETDGRLKVGDSGTELKTIPFGRLLKGGLICDYHAGKGDASVQCPTWVDEQFRGGDCWELCF